MDASRPQGDDALAADPFDWRVTKADAVLVSRRGRHVVTVGGARGARLAAQLQRCVERDDGAGAQRLLARATGNYKRGNERR